MTKSELILRLADKHPAMARDMELAVRLILEAIFDSLTRGERVEIRRFGSFDVSYRAPRVGRNPKTGESVEVSGKYVPHFKAGKDLRERVDLKA
jgi:integration host factor subunit beta